MARHGADACLLAAATEALDLLGRVLGRLPHLRALGEDLDRLAADLLDPVDGLRDAACGGDVGAVEHGVIVGGPGMPGPYDVGRVRPRSHGAVADRVPAHRRYSHVPVQLALRARPRRGVPAPHREHGHLSRGRRVRRADRALAALAGDRVGRSHDVPVGRDGPRKGRSPPAGARKAPPTRTRAPSGSGCRTKARLAGTTRSRAASTSRTRSSRTSCSCARTAARRTTSPRRSRTRWTGSRTSSAVTTTSRTPRSRSRCSPRWAPISPSTRTCRASSARTGASSRSGTARSRWTSSARPAISRRR